MPALALDKRALEVLADRQADPAGTRRVRAMLSAAVRLGLPVRVSTAVLSEMYRGSPPTPRSTLSLLEVFARSPWASPWLALRAPQRAGTGWTSVIPSMRSWRATSVRLGGGIIATGNSEDLRALSRDHPNVRVEPIWAPSLHHSSVRRTFPEVHQRYETRRLRRARTIHHVRWPRS